jgi:hypothetical protein
MLGANVFPVVGGLRVQYTLPGYSAHGLFLPGDVLTRASDGVWIYPLLTIADIELFKSRVGPGKLGTIEFYRPNVGTFFYWVSFSPVGGTTTALAQFEPAKDNSRAKGMFQGKKVFERSKPQQ